MGKTAKYVRRLAWHEAAIAALRAKVQARLNPAECPPRLQAGRLGDELEIAGASVFPPRWAQYRESGQREALVELDCLTPR